MVKAHPVAVPHTAGIFANTSIDGPEIGTLVVIVDRAKNLPNRKTIGKQDPYCAARLGKEARKTTTDVRGGQTPKWYRTSLPTRDPVWPRTDIICRDQELRFTVHDSPDYYQLKLSVFNDDKKTELIGEAWIDLRDIIIAGGGQNDLWQNLTCKGKYAGDLRIEITYYDSRPKPEKPAAKPKPVSSENDLIAGQHKMPKRRPLPSDPYTGQVPAQPPQPAPSHAPTPPLRPQPATPRDYPADYATPDHIQAPTRLPQQNPPPPHGTPSSLRHRQPDQYSPAPGGAYHTPPPRVDAHRTSLDRDSYPVYPEDGSYSPDHQGHTPDKRYTPSIPYGTSQTDLSFRPEDEDDRPPPPPVHRTTPGSGTPEPKYSPGREMAHQNQTPPIMRKDVLRNEAHRQSAPANAYPGRPVYRGHDSAPLPSSGNDLHIGGTRHSSPPRHHSFDSPYDIHHRSMQPTVEDVPDSPGTAMDDFRRSGSRAPPYNEPDYRQNPNPAPLHLSGRNSASAPQRQNPVPDYTQAELFLPSRDHAASTASQSSYDGHSQSSYSPYRNGGEDFSQTPDGSMRYDMPTVPTPLIPGVDPTLSLEISQRINEDRRQERRHTQLPPQNPPVGSMRGRQMIEPPPSYGPPSTEISQSFNTPQHGYDSYDHNLPYYHSGESSQSLVRRENSPGQSPGRHTIRRKSVSPAPPPQDGHRLSGVPFGPDSYDALNPSIVSALPKDQARQEKEYDEIGGKIITHDGKEVDPSDHLPMDTWAPEPEPKANKPSVNTSSRSSLNGPQPVPSSGRKPLRIREARPSSTSALSPATYIMPDTNNTPRQPPSTGRNRLQKKANRSSAMPIMMSGANGPGPLAPLLQPQDRDGFMPRPLGRASTADYENHSPSMYDNNTMSIHGGREHSISAPPIPAKIPLAVGSEMVPMNGAEYGGDMSLMEEMSRIDIGTGRARRHAQRPAIGGY